MIQEEVNNLRPVDVNGDGKINCVDYSITLYEKHPYLIDLAVVDLDGDGDLKEGYHMMCILTPSFSTRSYYIEPQGKGDMDFRRFWPSASYHALYIVTPAYLKGERRFEANKIGEVLRGND
jgi:hypothetical protein